MTMYEAVVKYAVGATDDEKIMALRYGLDEIAARLVGEFGLSVSDVELFLDTAADAAREEESMRDD